MDEPSPTTPPPNTPSGAKDPNAPDESLPDVSVRLSDFGVARRLRDDATHISAGFGWGTLIYMAPETVHQPTATFQFKKSVDVVGDSLEFDN